MPAFLGRLAVVRFWKSLPIAVFYFTLALALWPIGIITYRPDRRWGNCWVWGISKFLAEGGYLGIRFSRQTRYSIHCIWSPDLENWYGFVPVNPKTGWRALLDMWWFLGTVKKENDADDAHDERFEFHGSPNRDWRF